MDYACSSFTGHECKSLWEVLKVKSRWMFAFRKFCTPVVAALSQSFRKGLEASRSLFFCLSRRRKIIMWLPSYLKLQRLGTLTPSAQPPGHLPVSFNGLGRVCFILTLITRLSRMLASYGLSCTSDHLFLLLKIFL